MVLRVAAQHRERLLLVDVEALHQDALRLADQLARVDRLPEVRGVVDGVHRDRRVPGDEVRDLQVDVVEVVGPLVVEVEAPERAARRVQPRSHHAADAHPLDLLGPLRPSSLGAQVRHHHPVPVGHGVDVRSLSRLELHLVEVAYQVVGGGQRLHPAALVHEDDSRVAAAQRLQPELQDTVDGVVQRRLAVERQRQIGQLPGESVLDPVRGTHPHSLSRGGERPPPNPGSTDGPAA